MLFSTNFDKFKVEYSKIIVWKMHAILKTVSLLINWNDLNVFINKKKKKKTIDIFNVWRQITCRLFCTLMSGVFDGFLPKENNVSSKIYEKRDFDFTIVNFRYWVATFLLPCLLCITNDRILVFHSCYEILNRELPEKLPNQAIVSEFLCSPSLIDDRSMIESQIGFGN